MFALVAAVLVSNQRFAPDVAALVSSQIRLGNRMSPIKMNYYFIPIHSFLPQEIEIGWTSENNTLKLIL